MGAEPHEAARVEPPDSLARATEHQPAARAALAAALAAPSHAYLFAGPAGSGKRAAARAFVAELLAEGAPDPAAARRRALADPSPHPDLAWLVPRGNQHLVEEVRRQVIGAAAYRPFEGRRRAFVIEAAEAMADESQNALLKTLEEPAAFVHLVLLSAEPAALLETVRSRCHTVRFGAPAPDVVAAGLAAAGIGDGDAERLAAARLAGGDAERARFLCGDEGRALRAASDRCVEAALSGELGEAPWTALLEAAERAGELVATEVRDALEALAAEAGEGSPVARRRAREAGEESRRAGRRARTLTLDLGLGLIAARLRDLAAVADGAAELALHADRGAELAVQAEGLDPRRARRAAEMVMAFRRRLRVNVSEELALEAATFRLEALLGDA